MHDAARMSTGVMMSLNVSSLKPASLRIFQRRTPWDLTMSPGSASGISPPLSGVRRPEGWASPVSCAALSGMSAGLRSRRIIES